MKLREDGCPTEGWGLDILIGEVARCSARLVGIFPYANLKCTAKSCTCYLVYVPFLWWYNNSVTWVHIAFFISDGTNTILFAAGLMSSTYFIYLFFKGQITNLKACVFNRPPLPHRQNNNYKRVTLNALTCIYRPHFFLLLVTSYINKPTRQAPSPCRDLLCRETWAFRIGPDRIDSLRGCRARPADASSFSRHQWL